MNDVPSIPSRDDRTLLLAWSRARDEGAFTEFVQRHLGMVQGAALRKTTRPELAEDVAQAVFALAARRAASLAEHPSAGAWLHRTAVFESANALRRERKQRKIAAAMLVHPDTSPESGLPDAVLPHLDDALNSLPEHDRRAVLLRFGERLSYDQMAARLGKSADACQKQTSRALDRLRGLLSRRAAALSVTALSTGLTSILTSAATATTAAGKVSAAAIAAAPKISLTTVIHHLIRTMSTGKQIAAAAGVVALLAAVPLGLQHSDARGLHDQLAAHPVASRSSAAGKPAASRVTSASVREEPGSRVLPGCSPAEADRTIAMLRALRGRMLTSAQLFDIGQHLLALPPSHLLPALDALADFPGIMPAMMLRLGIFARWGELDPEGAMAAASAWKGDPISGEVAIHALASGWMERDSRGFALWLRDHPASAMTGPFATTLGGSSLSLLDRETVQQLRSIAPSGYYPGKMLLDWEAQAEDGDVARAARELLATAPDDHRRGILLTDAAKLIAKEDPRAAVDFVMTNPDPRGNVDQAALATAAGAWAEKDLESAAAWAWAQKGENMNGLTHVWKALSWKSEEEILAFVARAPDEAGRLHALERTALESARDPEKSLRLINTLPDENRHQAMALHGEIRAGESLMKTSEWLLTLPDGPDKNAAVRGFAPVLLRSEPESAFIWAASITDLPQRTELLRRMANEWTATAPAAAQNWLQSTDKLTDADRAAIAPNPPP